LIFAQLWQGVGVLRIDRYSQTGWEFQTTWEGETG
jgi:hypothetical protein